MMVTTPPQTRSELCQRAKQLAGMSLGELATRLNKPIPVNLRRDKGWVGQLLEIALGADANSKPLPDFQALNIELKTLPINKQGKPMESTFVCTIPLLDVSALTWKTSLVYRKLQCVLWVPVQADSDVPLAERMIATPFLWQPDAEQEAVLRTDWQELTDMISLGQLEQIRAHHGTYLQVRPKGANAKALTWGFDSEGNKILTLPRGFYLRSHFTAYLLQQYFL
ncbi:MAG: DNA mismatch repair endonuclease MutH [Gammaproteobacteria bacterium]